MRSGSGCLPISFIRQLRYALLLLPACSSAAGWILLIIRQSQLLSVARSQDFVRFSTGI